MRDLSIGVVAHVKRFHQARMLRKIVDAQCVSWDYGGVGARANHLSVWTMMAGIDSEWSLVLEDDALPVKDFRQNVVHALQAAPSPIVSLYLGTGNPICWQSRIQRALNQADKRDAHWLLCSNLIHAVSVAVRTDHVASMLESLHCSDEPIDESITGWAVKRFHSVAYTIPSLCDHDDGPTLMRHADSRRRTAQRVAWRRGVRYEWNSDTVKLAI